MEITNITFDELAIGDGIEVSRLVTARDVELFAVVSGDHNPLHLDPSTVPRRHLENALATAC
jgi:acyl dehydratase